MVAWLAALNFIGWAQADDFLLELPDEPQRKSMWCWASVSAMAAHSLDVRIGSRRVKQLDIVKFARLDVRNDAQRIAKKTQIRNSPCKLSNDECDELGEVWLYQVNGLHVPAGQVLSKARIIEEIQVRQRPVIIKWTYQHEQESEDLPVSDHYVIITGYNPDEDEFRVFDPWPVRDGSERWMPYEGYLQPGVDLGQPVFPVHEFDVYNLSDGAGQLEPGDASDDEVLDPAPRIDAVSLQDVGFDELGSAFEIVRARARDRVVFTPGRIRIAEPVREGRIFPIVVIRTRELLRTRERPQVLLQPRTSSLLAPVVTPSDGKVVDALLLYNNRGSWQEAPYANTGIARLLEQVQRRTPLDAGAPRDSYYLVSIPEQAALFAARGFGEDAMLKPLNARRDSGFVSAHEALTRLIATVDARSGRNNHAALAPGRSR